MRTISRKRSVFEARRQGALNSPRVPVAAKVGASAPWVRWGSAVALPVMAYLLPFRWLYRLVFTRLVDAGQEQEAT